MRGDARARDEGSPERRAGAARQPEKTEETASAAAALLAGRSVPPAVIPLLQRAAGNAAVASVLDEHIDGSQVHSVVSGGGQPLERSVQAAMESQLDVDLSDVRVHTDGRAARSAEAVNARAYTAGNHIVFQRQYYQPHTDAGLRMLAHELTHVVQQRSGPVDGAPVEGGVRVSSPADRFEQAAERNADQVVRAIGGAAGLSAAGDAGGAAPA